MCFVFLADKSKYNSTVRHALTRIFGVGFGRSSHICDVIGLAQNCKVAKLTRYKLGLILALIKRFYGVDLMLRRLRLNRLKIYLSVRSYNSLRLRNGLPIRGQGTHNNARTAKSRDLQSALHNELKKDIA